MNSRVIVLRGLTCWRWMYDVWMYDVCMYDVCMYDVCMYDACMYHVSCMDVCMCQATAMKLQQETAERQEQVALAQQRFEQGMPPTDDAEREWDRMIRRKEVRAILMPPTVLASAFLFPLSSFLFPLPSTKHV